MDYIDPAFGITVAAILWTTLTFVTIKQLRFEAKRRRGDHR